MTTTATEATVWPLHVANVHGETRMEAMNRISGRNADAQRAVEQCVEVECEGREDAENAARDLASIIRGDRDEFSLDGFAEVTWTTRGDIAGEAADRAVWADCH